MPRRRARAGPARMAEWARLTPAERGQARLRFQEAQADSRDRPGDALGGLSGAAARAAAALRGARRGGRGRAASVDVGARPARAAGRDERSEAQGRTSSPTRRLAQPPRPVAPTLVQAAPGATTTLITRRPSPPPHQQTGMPKIAATPEFVNQSTLLPRRGAAGGCVRFRRRRSGRARPPPATPRPPRPRPRSPAAVGPSGVEQRRRDAAPSLRSRGAWPASSTKRLLLFGIGPHSRRRSAPLFFAQTGHAIRCRARPRCAALRLVLYGLYFVWLLVEARPDAAMQTWHIRIVTPAGARLPQGARAAALRWRAGPGSRRRRCSRVAAALDAVAEPRRGRRRHRALRAARAARIRSASSGTTGCAARASSTPRGAPRPGAAQTASSLTSPVRMRTTLLDRR